MTTLTKNRFALTGDQGFSSLKNKDRLYSRNSQTQPIKNNWIFATSSGALVIDNITCSDGIIVGEHVGGTKPSMTDIINQSPKLLKEINGAREGLKHEHLLDDKDIFGK